MRTIALLVMVALAGCAAPPGLDGADAGSTTPSRLADQAFRMDPAEARIKARIDEDVVLEGGCHREDLTSGSYWVGKWTRPTDQVAEYRPDTGERPWGHPHTFRFEEVAEWRVQWRCDHSDNSGATTSWTVEVEGRSS